ncbi:purine-nucleoside phosphorylase [Paenibacillus sp. GCM10012307]|uniref:Purine nucleoside phosphorylase n=1 Tax=Paenibacillus roseus TaxID=2798579 RepID=A0A934MSP3_9BACL|nr:purine-nucleoside phosphorylase [Paenibacillus roseus]MBJ6363459.1 purine-nucleoside phosphorylase [Paenibacillus roseus]
MHEITASHIQEAAGYITSLTSDQPEIGLIMGSGLGILSDYIEDATIIPYHQIPHFPISTVVGHAGELLIGKLAGRTVVLMSGRFHMYEGYGPELTAFPVRVMKALGVKHLIVTNAAGGINIEFKPGDLMVITDHINLTGRNPLVGRNDEELGDRFPDMSQAYSRRLGAIAKDEAAKLGFGLREGVYVGVLGPSYETPAEIRMMRTMGADAVGMSTVAEVIAARHSGIEVLGISCISNMASGILDQPLSHQEVIETTDKAQAQFLSLILAVIPAV